MTSLGLCIANSLIVFCCISEFQSNKNFAVATVVETVIFSINKTKLNNKTLINRCLFAFSEFQSNKNLIVATINLYNQIRRVLCYAQYGE